MPPVNIHGQGVGRLVRGWRAQHRAAAEGTDAGKTVYECAGQTLILFSRKVGMTLFNSRNSVSEQQHPLRSSHCFIFMAQPEFTTIATLGKGGCQPTTTSSRANTTNAMPTKIESNGNGTMVTMLEKERQQKINSEPKFYWAHDEEPHRRR
jgi:hypothetical protein